MGSTRERRVVTFFALSRGTEAPQLLQWIITLLPLPPLERPRLFLFLDKRFRQSACILLKRMLVCPLGAEAGSSKLSKMWKDS
jgi:hypothetical protein